MHINNSYSTHQLSSFLRKEDPILITETEPNLKGKTKGILFPKAKRFKSDFTLTDIGPGSYSHDNSMISSHLGTKLGLGSKSPVAFPHLLMNPGPGSYETVDLNNLKETITRGVKFPHSEQKTFDEIVKKSIGPAPGDYERKLGKKTDSKGTFAKADRYNYIKTELPSIGPGKYNVRENLILENKMYFGGKFGESAAERLKQKIIRRLPGPGAYNVVEKKGGRSVGFGKCSHRPDIFGGKSASSPGPGAYN